MRMKISTPISEGKFTTKKKLVVPLQNPQGESATTTAKTAQNLLMAVEIIQLITVHLKAHHAAQLTRTALREAQTLAIALREVQVATVLQALDIVHQVLAIVGPVLVRQVPDILRQALSVALRKAPAIVLRALAILQQVLPIALREALHIVRHAIVQQVFTTALREVP